MAQFPTYHPTHDRQPFDPARPLAGYPRETLLRQVARLTDWWLKEHEIRPLRYGEHQQSLPAVYRPHVGEVVVDSGKCLPPCDSSWPGSPHDRSVAGEMLREVGVHVWETIREEASNFRSWRRHLTAWQEARSNEKPVDPAREDSVERAFCEAFRLYLLNPELLREGRPHRHELLSGSGIRAPHAVPWRDVLSSAPACVIARTEAWVG